MAKYKLVIFSSTDGPDHEIRGLAPETMSYVEAEGAILKARQAAFDKEGEEWSFEHLIAPLAESGIVLLSHADIIYTRQKWDEYIEG